MLFDSAGRFLAALFLLMTVMVGAPRGSPGTTSGGMVVGTSDDIAALGLLELVPVAREHRGGYDRSLFPTAIDAGDDRCSTRIEVLRRESAVPVKPAGKSCVVLSGLWMSPYDGLITTDPSALDVDHVVSLKEAWDSGAWAWPPDRRRSYANDLTDRRTLLAASASSNRSKGDRDPSNWLPVPTDQCRYLGDWVATKARWGLTADQSEWGRIRNVLRAKCPGLLIAAPLPAPPDAGVPRGILGVPSSSATTGAAPTTATAPPRNAPPRNTPPPVPSTVYFKSCADARTAGAAPLNRDDPGYRSGLDRDGDGVACEN